MRSRQLFNEGWSFCKTSLDVKPEEMFLAEEGFQAINLPHDWLIYHTKNLYEDSMGWYRKEFIWNPEEGERAILRFDGIYMDSTIYINGQSACEWKYGYSTFDVDMTDYLRPNEKNLILVQVRHQSPNSRWYSGAGIYRNVWLKICPKVYLPFDGTYVLTQKEENGFVLKAETELVFPNEAAADVEHMVCRYRLWKGTELVQELGEEQWRRPAQKQEYENAFLAEQGKQQDFDMMKVGLESHVENLECWDIQNPSCYELTVELMEHTSAEDKVIDTQRITVGFRTIVFDSEKGLFLNGKRVKVHGVCEHHDFGCLGAVYYEAAMERKFDLLRKMGVNALRTSHNMPAPELMEMADRKGFLILSEAFDMWEKRKTEYDYARFFHDWAKRDVASWIRRDRNHPCLLLWSIGNEIYDTHVDESGQEITRRLVAYVRSHDSGYITAKTNETQSAPVFAAPVTIGSNFMPWENARKCADIVKYAGYNYAEKYYNEHHKQHPDWIIYGSETASIVQSRGIYHFPFAQSILADEDEQCSALGNSATSWGAESIEKCITDDRDTEYAFGQFLWTGFDYIGEPTPYHTKNSYFGQLDTAGFPKDSYYIFASEWTDVREQPMVHVFPYWDFNEGQLIDVRACTNASAVELFVNGVSRGRQSIDHIHGKRLLGDWQVVFEPGVITAVAYDEVGKEVARESRTSFGDSRKICLTTDCTSLVAGSRQLCFLTVETCDKQGRKVENACDFVKVEVTGAGCLLGLDNGDSTDYDEYKGSCRRLFSGKLLAVIGAKDQAGEIEVKVSAEGLESASVRIAVLTGGSEQYMEEMTEPRAEKSCLIPVRKIQLAAPNGQLLTQQQPEIEIVASIFPPQAQDKELIWKAVNDAGVEVGYVQIIEQEVSSQQKGNVQHIRIRGLGDGKFRVRCMSKSGTNHICLISQLEMEAEGFGQILLSPYQFISAALYNSTIGEIGNGNEKGIATARESFSGVVYENIDFGDFGSNRLTMWVFALSDEEYPIEIWLGNPEKQDSRLLTTVIYQKPSQWNVYQEQSFELPERIKGVVTIAICLRAKVHIKGFIFSWQNKAREQLFASEADRIYGDSFEIVDKEVKGIGNNVTLVFEQMDFGEDQVTAITVGGHTPLSVNTMHILFTDEEGKQHRNIVEFQGDETCHRAEQTFSLTPWKGKGKIEFVFLPGSHFDFSYFRFL